MGKEEKLGFAILLIVPTLLLVLERPVGAFDVLLIISGVIIFIFSGEHNGQK